MNGIELAGLEVAHDWIVAGVNVPTEVLDSVRDYQRGQSEPVQATLESP